jgi:ketosteroid isomerase-like protein
MATTDNKQLMQHIFTEAAQGNLEPFLEHMAEDMRWTVIGTTKFSGTLTGKQEVLDKRLTPPRGPARWSDPRHRSYLHCRWRLRGGRGTRPGHD